ncbi:unnamed protein product [Allacma fusca]|uniref:Uncharacterized protein n=1 Tax=Allacma fusca TaxID=39272 RepID=A0A8J2NIN3_9HEXA|nr:unnamed protein product [Allacma fusca]
MPTLVTQVFLGNLRDVRLLKICRLVCKSWNIEGSHSLRACSKVCIKEGSSRLKNFTTLVLQKALGQLNYLPSPFQNLHVEVSTFTNPTFIEFVMKVPITSLNIFLDRVNGRQLGSFLAANKTSLTDLEIRTFSHFGLDKYKTINSVKLTCLNRLALKDFCSSCTHIQFFEGILSRCKPGWLDLWFSNKDALAYLLPAGNAENLKKLQLTVSGISKKAWKHLGNLRFSRLRSLWFLANDSIHEPDDLQQWQLFCQNASPLLEDFETNLPISFAQELIFSNLKSIRIEDTIVWSYFTPKRFPSLVEIIFDFLGQLNIKAQNEVPHRVVSSLSIMMQGDRVDKDSLKEDLMRLLTIPRRKSITDFLELETIKFGWEFVMNPLMLRHCLPMVPKLRQIYLYWNDSLSAPLLSDTLSHLERIVICNHAEGRFKVAMAQVAENSPNAFMG